jgi:hypothetical protein
MEESVAGPVRELDEPVPLTGVEPFHFALNRQAGWFLELWFGKSQRNVGFARQLVETILLNDAPSSLTKISAFFQDEFPNRLPRG